MTFREFLKRFLIALSHYLGFFPTKISSVQSLERLIQDLHPLDCGRDLIRLGPNGDGGYLIPNDLEEIKACFSPGVSKVSGFEKALADLGIEIFLADHSVDGPIEDHQRFHFIKKFIGAVTNEVFLTLDQWVEQCMPDSTGDLILQMDIEGYEYETLIAVSDCLMRRFRIIVIEFHQLDLLFSEPFFRMASSAFSKILQTHECVHIHPNNVAPTVRKRNLSIPPIMEFTFVRRDRFLVRRFRSNFPHPLDFDCAEMPSLVLPECWYASE